MAKIRDLTAHARPSPPNPPWVRPGSAVRAFHQKPCFTAAHQKVLEALRHMGKAVLVRHVAELCCAAGLHAFIGVPAGHRLPQHPAVRMHQQSGGAIHHPRQRTCHGLAPLDEFVGRRRLRGVPLARKIWNGVVSSVWARKSMEGATFWPRLLRKEAVISVQKRPLRENGLRGKIKPASL